MYKKTKPFLAAILVAFTLAACSAPFDRYMLEGQAAMDKNEYEKARTIFHKAVLEARRSPKAKANLVAALEAEAACAESLKQTADEIKLLEEAARACKADPTLGAKRAGKLEKRMGDLAYSMDDQVKAFEYYKQALQTLETGGFAKSGESASVYVALGDMYSLNKSYKEARTWYETGLTVFDETEDIRKYLDVGATLNKLANCYRELGDEDRAAELESQARTGQIAGARGQIRKMLSGIPGGK